MCLRPAYRLKTKIKKYKDFPRKDYGDYKEENEPAKVSRFYLHQIRSKCIARIKHPAILMKHFNFNAAKIEQINKSTK